MSRPGLLHAVCCAFIAATFFLQPLAAVAGTSSEEAWPIVAPAPAADPHPLVQLPDDAPIVPQEKPAVVAQSMGAPVHRHMPLWPLGIDYTLDASLAWSLGTTGAPQGSGLPGGMDVLFRYGFSPNTRVVIGYYDLQEYPLGFDTGTVPVYLQGVATPIAGASLAAAPLNATIQNHLVIAHVDQIIWTKLMGQDFPLIFSPTYTSRWGSIGGGTDYLPIEINGLPYFEHYRTGTYWALGLTLPLPLLTQPKYHLLTTYTVGPQWVASGATGANATNSPQLVQILHVQWHPTPRIQIDLQPSLYPNILPTDQWPQHYLTMIYSLAYSFGRPHLGSYGYTPFVQATLTSGGAMNESPYGISGLYCQALPCNSPSQLVPSLGGNHATQVQLKLGIGRPDVIPL